MNKENQFISELKVERNEQFNYSKKDSKEKPKSFLRKLGEFKLLNNKNGKIILLSILLIFIIFLYYRFSSLNKSSSTSLNYSNSYYTSSLEYAKEIENKLVSVLSNISGAGKTTVMVTLSSSLEIIYAESVDEKNNSTISETTSTSSTNTSQNTIIVKNNGENMPLIVKEILPNIKGVVVVCEGAKDVSIKLKIVQAVKALLDIPSNNIQVLC